MVYLLNLILHLFRLATLTSHPVAGTSLRVITDRLTGQQVLAADWKDISHVQAWLGRRKVCGAYLLVGWRDERVRIRVGEGVKLWNRLGDHKKDATLNAFVKEIYVLASRVYNKSATVYLQEQLSEIVEAEERIDWHKGVKQLRDFPLSDDDRQVLDVGILFGLNLLNTAGLRILEPAQSRLAGQIAALLTKAGAR